MEHLLLQAEEEIRTQRRRIELLQARVDTMDLMATFLHTEPFSVARGQAVDVAWLLKEAREKIIEDSKAS